jgi:hypothetical protein
MHGTGTAFVGSIIAYMFWLYVATTYPATFRIWVFNFLPTGAIPPLIVGFHLVSYYVAKGHCQGFISTILVSHLSREHEATRAAQRIVTTEPHFER